MVHAFTAPPSHHVDMHTHVAGSPCYGPLLKVSESQSLDPLLGIK